MAILEAGPELIEPLERLLRQKLEERGYKINPKSSLLYSWFTGEKTRWQAVKQIDADRRLHVKVKPVQHEGETLFDGPVVVARIYVEVESEPLRHPIEHIIYKNGYTSRGAVRMLFEDLFGSYEACVAEVAGYLREHMPTKDAEETARNFCSVLKVEGVPLSRNYKE